MNISDAEWEVMQVVWRRRSVTAAEVIEALVPRTGWSHRTVRTLLARLVDKGVLAVEQEGHRYRYRPLVSRSKCVREAGQSFLTKVFGGDPAELLAHFVRHADMTEQEIARLRELLDRKQRGEK
jgi:BlaI family transcriptional regulator, penicillinase repressor